MPLKRLCQAADDHWQTITLFVFVCVQLTRPAQDLLMSLCMNCNSHGADDMEVISNLIKIRLKPKVLLNHYMLCVRLVELLFVLLPPCCYTQWLPLTAVFCRWLSRELLNAHRDNLGTMVKLVIFNELSNARNPNNMQVLHTVLQHSPEQAPKVRLDTFWIAQRNWQFGNHVTDLISNKYTFIFMPLCWR